MSVCYSAEIKHARLEVVRAAIDRHGPGELYVYDDKGTKLISFTLNHPCGVVADNTLAIDTQGLFSPHASASGRAHHATICDARGQRCIEAMSCGGPMDMDDMDEDECCDIQLDDPNIKAGQGTFLTGAYIQHG